MLLIVKKLLEIGKPEGAMTERIGDRVGCAFFVSTVSGKFLAIRLIVGVNFFLSNGRR
jgi:hypothetical protein